MGVAVCVGLSGLVTPSPGLPLYGCCRMPYSSASSMRSVFDRFQTPLSPGLLRLPPLSAGLDAGVFERSAMDGLGFGLDLTSIGTPGLGMPRIPPPPTMLLCPTPHYAVTVAGTVAGAPADVKFGCGENRSAAAGSASGDGWMLAKSSSIAELRLKAQQYAAMLDLS